MEQTVSAASENDGSSRSSLEETPQAMEDRRLDEALAETFPASDPVSIVQPAKDHERPDDPPGSGRTAVGSRGTGR